MNDFNAFVFAANQKANHSEIHQRDFAHLTSIASVSHIGVRFTIWLTILKAISASMSHSAANRIAKFD